MERRHRKRVEAHFNIHHQPWADLPTIKHLGGSVSGVWTNGTIGLSGEAMRAMPALQIILAQGTGYENIDLVAARERSIAVATGAGTNAECAADHATALLLSLVREIPSVDRRARAGEWAELRVSRPAIYGKRLGIVGLGRIGQLIARRAMGFDLEVAYHTRRELAELPYRHEPDLVALAAWADFLVLACPGGPTTRGMVNAAVLEALGAGGYLVNVARGSVIDTPALIAALRKRRIAGAALDVFENEPGIPPELRELPNVVLTAHLAGSAPEVREAQIELALSNLDAFFGGEPLVNRLV